MSDPKSNVFELNLKVTQMESQIKEVLEYRGKAYAMACEPLDQYFSQLNPPLRFYPKFKNNARGYLGKWAILENELHLIDFIGVLENKHELFLDGLFPGEQTVFARWFNGTILLNYGKLLALKNRYRPALYEKDLHLEIANGYLINSHVVENKCDTTNDFYDNLRPGKEERLVWK